MQTEYKLKQLHGKQIEAPCKNVS